MAEKPSAIRAQALQIWKAGVNAVKPAVLIQRAVADQSWGLRAACAHARRIVVVGAGKAGAAMAEAIETQLKPYLDRMVGWVNVPDTLVRPLKAITLHGARPAGHNQPTQAGVEGAERIG